MALSPVLIRSSGSLWTRTFTSGQTTREEVRNILRSGTKFSKKHDSQLLVGDIAKRESNFKDVIAATTHNNAWPSARLFIYLPPLRPPRRTCPRFCGLTSAES